ncbi:MAG: hypothetical protein JRD05_00690 [Deltaproteobacteria bacterium]|nr:hypothetical protein [Deltaproteobacteria bacterium]
MNMLRRLKIPGILAVIFALLALLVVSQANAAEYWKQKFEYFSAEAGEALVVGDVVCVKPADGEIYKADADDGDLRPAIGVIGEGGAADTIVQVVTRGILAGQTSASPGSRLYLSETAGAFTTTQPTNPQCLGWVLPNYTASNASDEYFLDIEPSGGTGPGY